MDIPNVINYSTLEEAKKDFSSCDNTKKIMEYAYKQYGDSSYKYYSAFKTALDYAPAAIPETKGKWCIPAVGILNNIYENDKIDAGLEKIGLREVTGLLWASTEASINEGWIFSKNSHDKNEIFRLFEKDDWFTHSGNPIGNFAILPVIEF